jgi:NAD(P)-dependent dehydrogenase (short-subunit alcohol dehydrogenase family)
VSRRPDRNAPSFIPPNAKLMENCKEIVDAAVAAVGTMDILADNAAYQIMKNNISGTPEEQWLHIFDANTHLSLSSPTTAWPT